MQPPLSWRFRLRQVLYRRERRRARPRFRTTFRAAPLPPLNLGTIKDLLLEYHQKYYDIDVAAVFDSAQKYIEQNAAQSKRPALVLDIDETSLTNWPNLLADNFGFVADGSCDVLPTGPCGFNQWILKGSAKAIEPARKLFEAAKAKGVAVIFITGRTESQRDITVLNLDHAGFEGWTELRTRPDRDDLLTVQEFKTAERTKVEAEGYTIIADVGDQISDLEGEHSRMPLQGAESVLLYPIKMTQRDCNLCSVPNSGAKWPHRRADDGTNSSSTQAPLVQSEGSQTGGRRGTRTTLARLTVRAARSMLNPSLS